jgi:quinol monooxygenase YgiN
LDQLQCNYPARRDYRRQRCRCGKYGRGAQDSLVATKYSGTISLRTEPGVLTMYAVSEKENPCKVTILETYASREAYEKHIASEHFQKYKQGTLHMVKSLVLSDQTLLNPTNRINNFIQ